MLALLAISCGVACSSSTATDPDAGKEDAGADAKVDGNDSDAGELGYAPCAIAQRLGTFRVELAQEYSAFQGQLFDGVVPANVPEEGPDVSGCRLMRGRALFCDPSCDTEHACDVDGSCVPYPRAQTAGTVSVSGLKIPLSLEPSSKFLYTNPPMFPHPGFDVGAAIHLTATAPGAGFNLLGQGVEPFVLSEAPLTIARDSAMEITWDGPKEEGPAQVHIELNINKHGTTRAWVECEAPDTGSASIPQELVTGLMDVGVSGFPTLTISRRTADSTALAAGCVELLVVSERAVAVEVEGLTSCNDSSDCPDGQTCQVDLTCR